MIKSTMIVLALSALVCVAEEAKEPVPASNAKVAVRPKRIGPRDISKKKARSMARIAEQGGMVAEEYTGNFIRILTTQNQVSLEALDEIGKGVEKMLGIPVKTAMVPPEANSIDLIEKGFALERTGAVIAVVDKQRGPALLTAPESAWAVVNVDVLSADGNKEKLNRRVKQEIWRGLVFALNGTDSQMQPCLMTIVRSIGNLDRNPLEVPSPEPMMKMLDGCTARGMRRARRASYRRACAEGWAPAPTNAVQKAIWAEHHANPSEPMKIKFDPKKGE